MTEEQSAPTPRTLKEIELEYASCCGQVGDKSYRVDCLTNEVRALYRRMRELNQESAALKASVIAEINAKTEEIAATAKENPA